MATFQQNIFISIIISKLNLFSKHGKKLFSSDIFKKNYYKFDPSEFSRHSEDHYKNENSRLNSINNGMFLNRILVECKPISMDIEDFKNSIRMISDSYETENHPTIVETEKYVKINVKIRNKKDIIHRITRFLNITNENSSFFQNSTIFNDWKLFENNDGKKIQVIFGTSNGGKGELNIYIPNSSDKNIEIEYIKPIDSLYRKDLEAISSLINPLEEQNIRKIYQNISQKENIAPNYFISKLSDKIFEINSMEHEAFNQFESFFENFNLANHIMDTFNITQPGINFSKMGKSATNNRLNGNIDGSYEQIPVTANKNKVVSALEELGVQIYMNDENNDKENNENPWDFIGGYEDVKRQIEEHILLHLKHPDVLEKIVSGTRIQKDSSNRPKLILFEGPPGTGKTTSARIIGDVIKVPLIYVSLENIVSKWYGESETRLAQIFDLAKNFKQGCIIFIDEIDTMASSRDKTYSMHEGSKKILSVLLRKLDGFDTLNSKTLLICATNRRRDLDEAFINRIDSTVYFPLPNEKERELIFRQYAKHLTLEERTELAKMTKKLSGRSIRHVCLEAEREWASKIIKRKEENGDKSLNVELPIFKIYKDAVKKRCG